MITLTQNLKAHFHTPNWAICIGLFAILACGNSPQVDLGHSGETILEVNNKRYSLEEFHFYMDLNYHELDKNGDPELLSHVLDKFKREIILAELANFRGYFISEDQVSDFIENKMTTMSFHLKPAKEQDFWQAIIRRRLAIQSMLQNEMLRNANVDDQAIQNYYQSHQADYQGETLYQIRVAQLGDKETADELLKKLKKSREPFTKTVAPFAANEGYLIAETYPIEGLIQPFQKAVNRLRPGRYSKPIPVKQGELTVYYVLYLEAVFPAEPVSYEEAHYDIKTKLHKMAAEKLLEAHLSQFQERLPVTLLENHLPFRYIEASKRSENQ